MKYDLTLAKIRNTDFASLYDRFVVGEKLSQKQYEILLAIAICFTNADDINVQQLGYRIVVEYCNQTNDYIPLYEIAVNKGLYPVSKFIEQHYIDDSKRNFSLSGTMPLQSSMYQVRYAEANNKIHWFIFLKVKNIIQSPLLHRHHTENLSLLYQQ